jgi:hypothetical protein
MKIRGIIGFSVLACVAFHPENGRTDILGLQDIGRAIEKASQDVGKAIEKAGHEIEKTSMDIVLAQLASLPLDRLYALKVWPDVCAADIVKCGPLPSDRVRTFVDVELDRRKAALDYRDKRNAFLVSIGSLIISGCALLISGFVAFRTPPAQKPIET